MRLKINDTIIVSNNKKKEIKLFFPNEQERSNFQIQSGFLNKKFKNYKVKSFINRNMNYIDKVSGDYDDLENLEKREKEKVKFVGKLQSYTSKRTKNGSYLFLMEFKIPFKNKLIEGVFFRDNENFEDLLDEYEYFEIEGRIQKNDYYQKSKADYNLNYQDYNIFVNDIKYIINTKKFERKRPSKMRTELHLHTYVSKRDAFIKGEDLKQSYSDGKIKAAAITDHGCNYSFPEIKRETENSNIKIFPGIEVYVVDDDKINEYKDLEDLINEYPRNHVTLLNKAKDRTKQVANKTITYNPGIKEINRIISISYKKWFSNPKKNKSMGSRNVILKSELRKIKNKNLFVIGSACALGEVKNALMKNNKKEAFEKAKLYDYLEIMPIHNDLFAIESEEYPNINSKKDLYIVNKLLYKIAKKLNKKIIFTSDAHIVNKEDREIRMWFKRGYFSMLKNRYGADIGEVFDEITLEEQPYIMDYDQMMEELNNAGFNKQERMEIANGENIIGQMCTPISETTLIPKKLLIPKFPGVDLKLEVPEIAYDFAHKKWGNLLPKPIQKRLDYEIEATQKKDYEFLYFAARHLVKYSEELGYQVGSRGSVGSSFLAYCLGITDVNPLKPHYLCNKCKKIHFIDNDVIGTDLENKKCPHCGGTMIGDGYDIKFENFVGLGGTKVPDID